MQTKTEIGIDPLNPSIDQSLQIVLMVERYPKGFVIWMKSYYKPHL